jgi:hypothetical protein
MPDWSYHTVLRPAASLLPRGRVRPLVLNALAAIARLPGGGTFIHLLGQLDPPAPLAREVAGMPVTSPVGLGGGVDPNGLARDAFARFGFGVIELAAIRSGLRGRVSALPASADPRNPSSSAEAPAGARPRSRPLRALRKR